MLILHFPYKENAIVGLPRKILTAPQDEYKCWISHKDLYFPMRLIEMLDLLGRSLLSYKVNIIVGFFKKILIFLRGEYKCWTFRKNTRQI